MRGRVLIVDDDPDICETVQLLLELNGFEVHALHDGIAATQLDTRYDAVVVDLKMPVFDGERLMDYWAMTGSELVGRVIIMSGYSHNITGRLRDAFAVIRKPYEPDHLVRVVTACAARQAGQSKEDSQ